MSMNNIVFYGFGIDTSEKFDFKNLKSFQEAIALCGEEFKNGWLAEVLAEARTNAKNDLNLPDENITEAHLFRYLPDEWEHANTDFTCGGCVTVAEAVLQNILCTQEDIGVDIIVEGGTRAVMLLEGMPWEHTEAERNLTQQKLEDIFRKYCGIISGNTSVVIKYQTIEVTY